MTQYVLKGDISNLIDESAAVITQDTQYPYNWPKADIPGLQAVVPTDPPNSTDFNILGHTVQMIGGVPTQVWDAVAKTDAERADEVARYLKNVEIHAEQVIQSFLDEEAKKHRFSNINNAVGWSTTYPIADQLRVWAKSCWDTAEAIEAAVLSGARTLPTDAELLAEMPIFVQV